MKKVKVALIDSGISNSSPFINNVSSSFKIQKVNGKYEMISCEPNDYIGHGTAVNHIICTNNTDVDIICIRICDNMLDIEEIALITVLEYIYNQIDLDIINISAGITYLYYYDELKSICQKLFEKGIIIVSAFDNDGAISYPAAFEEVIGVDIKAEYEDKRDIFYVENSIVNIYVPDIFYRTMWNSQKTIIKGTSFAAARITGLLSKLLPKYSMPGEIKCLLYEIASKNIEYERNTTIKPPSFQINKAILFPFNKESSSLLKFKDMLNFVIAGVYDERLSGNVDKELYGEKIKSYININWDDDFDTIILSCSSNLSKLTKHDYANEIFKKAQKYNKNVYSFEEKEADCDQIFYPKITSDMVPYKNNLKLHKVTIPILGVFGTSSKQGKFTLQLELIRHLSSLGYNVGNISTEPSGYLFNADYVFHFGYHANLKIKQWESIAILNQMVWETQLKNKDILITGCQSGTIHYNNSGINDFALSQYAFILGVMPDFCILCVNPHDDRDYIERTIHFIDAIDEGKVNAIVVFPMQIVETLSRVKYKTQALTQNDLHNIKEKLNDSFHIPVYSLGNDDDIKELCDLIIHFFEED